ncbi:MAG: erg26, C-3 sterol dehydrogenase [Alyxoria varia]|nr:MAG: erg26, C-3 sterol dehydrogenase [Alyxoria varia]
MASIESATRPLGNVMVVGGCGFLGSHIVSLLLSRYGSTVPATHIHVCDIRTPSEGAQEGASYHTADITDPSSVASLFNKIKPDVIIHTASPNVELVKTGKKARDTLYKVNVQGTKVLLEEAKRVGARAFVYTSSASVISDTRNNLVNADERYRPIRGKLQKEYYADTKAEAEQAVVAANTRPSKSESPFLTVALRPSGIFGERDVQLIPPMLKVFHSARTGFQIGDNNNLFDFTYVGNAAHAHCLAAAGLLSTSDALLSSDEEERRDMEEREPGDKVDGEAILITNASPIYFWDFAKGLWFKYYRACLSLSKSSGQESSSPPLPEPVSRPFVLPSGPMLVIAIIITWVTWLLQLPPPSLNPLSVRVSCMTRYFQQKKALGALGYAPVWTMDEALDRTALWFAEQRRSEGVKKVQ